LNEIKDHRKEVETFWNLWWRGCVCETYHMENWRLLKVW